MKGFFTAVLAVAVAVLAYFAGRRITGKDLGFTKAMLTAHDYAYEPAKKGLLPVYDKVADYVSKLVHTEQVTPSMPNDGRV